MDSGNGLNRYKEVVSKVIGAERTIRKHKEHNEAIVCFNALCSLCKLCDRCVTYV